jgi:hypothetical protein
VSGRVFAVAMDLPIGTPLPLSDVLGARRTAGGSLSLRTTSKSAGRDSCIVAKGAVLAHRLPRHSLLSWTNLSSRPGARRVTLFALALNACGRLSPGAAHAAQDDTRSSDTNKSLAPAPGRDRARRHVGHV